MADLSLFLFGSLGEGSKRRRRPTKRRSTKRRPTTRRARARRRSKRSWLF